MDEDEGTRTARNWLSSGVIVSGLALALLTFTPWLKITHFVEFLGPVARDVDGSHVYGLTAFGDGRLAAALGIIAVVLGLAQLRLASLRRFLAPGIAIMGFVTSGIALYDALYDWGSQAGHLGQRPDVDIAIGLCLTLALGLSLGIAGLLLTGLSRGTQKSAESIREKAEGWA